MNVLAPLSPPGFGGATTGGMGPLILASSSSSTRHYYDDDDSRWKAVQGREAAADGAFVYCVRTTKIYCRPVCKSRLARRGNVVFFADPRDARRAGFRACKRCKPDAGSRMPDEEATRKIQRYIHESTSRLLLLGSSRQPPSLGGQHHQLHPDESGGGDHSGDGNDHDDDDRQKEDGVSGASFKPETLESMSRRVGLSKWHFHRVFKNITGMTPAEYTAFCRKLSVSQAEKQGGEDVSVGSLDLDAFPWDEGLLTPEHNLPTPSTSEPVSRETTVAAAAAMAEGWDGLSPDRREEEGMLDWMNMDISDMPDFTRHLQDTDVKYAVRTTAAGALLVVFQDRKVQFTSRNVDAAASLAELEQRLPGSIFTHQDVDVVASDANDAYRQRVDDIVTLFSRDV